MSSPTTTYLITGGNRGIGFAYVKALSELPNTTVYATTRSESAELSDFAAEHPNVKILTLSIDDDASVQSFNTELSKIKGLNIDYFISNAGMSQSYDSFRETSKESIVKHFLVNCVGPIEVYKVVAPYLSEGSKLIFITSALGSISLADHFPFHSSAYGASKAYLNYVVKDIVMERKDKGICIALEPGFVATDLGLAGLKVLKESNVSVDIPLLTPEESVSAQLKVIHDLTAEDAGKFLKYDGSIIPF